MAYGTSIPQIVNKHGPGFQLTTGRVVDCVNGTGSTLPVGRFMIKDSLSGDVVSAKLPLAAAFTAKSITHVIANWSSGETVSAIITFRGTTVIVGPVAFDTDNNTSVAALEAAVNTALDARFTAGQSLLATDTTGSLAIAAELAGEDFDCDVAYTGNITATKVVAGTTFKDLVLGVSLDQGAAVVNASDAVVIEDGVGFSCAKEGDVSVEMAAAAATSRGDGLYIITGSDAAEAGKVSASAGAGRVWVPRELVRWTDASATSTFQPRGAIARVSLNL